MPDAAKNGAAYGAVEINDGESLITQTELPDVHVPAAAPSGRSPVRLLAYGVCTLGLVALGASYGSKESSAQYEKDHMSELSYGSKESSAQYAKDHMSEYATTPTGVKKYDMYESEYDDDNLYRLVCADFDDDNV